jgi:hypothetical protein
MGATAEDCRLLYDRLGWSAELRRLLELLSNTNAHPDAIRHAAESLLAMLPPGDALCRERSALARLLRTRLLPQD